MPDSPETTMRLARYLAQCGLASRRRCDDLIRQGRIEVNRKVVLEPATVIDPDSDRITQQGIVIKPEPMVYYLLHKPTGYTCTNHDRHAKRKAVDLITDPRASRIFSIGRLDANSEGLLLFTNDGDLSHKLLHPSYGIRKTYLVDCKGKLYPKALNKLLQGIQDGPDFLIAKEAEIVARSKFGIRLRVVVAEGKKREVRRMCKALGLQVKMLLRTSFGPIQLGKYQPGRYRELNKKEVLALKDAVSK